MSQTWNILGGFTGQLSLGHSAFFGIGAYTSTLLFVNFKLTPWIGLFIGIFLGMVMGGFIGYLSFRFGIRGAFFALVTLAFAEILRLIALNVDFSGGPIGISIPIKGDSLLYFQSSQKYFFYYTILIMTIFAIALVYLLKKSKVGLFLNTIRDSEEAAEAIGVNTFRWKMVAIMISASLAAIGGTFYAQYLMYIEPNSIFGWPISVEVVVCSIMGGAGTVWGPILGSAILGLITEFTRTKLGGYSSVHMMSYGAVLIVMMMFLPEGIYGKLSKIIRGTKK